MEVKIVEDFLESSDFDKVTERLQYPASWRMQSSDGEDGSQQFLYLDVSEEKYFNTYIFKQIKKHLDGEYKLERIYFNGQWTGREGYMHDDNCDIKDNNRKQQCKKNKADRPSDLLTKPNVESLVLFVL